MEVDLTWGFMFRTIYVTISMKKKNCVCEETNNVLKLKISRFLQLKLLIMVVRITKIPSFIKTSRNEGEKFLELRIV